MQILSLGYVGIESKASEEWRTFAPEIFGLAIGEDGGDGAIRIRMDDRAYRLSIHPADHDQLSYVGWELRNSTEFAAAVDELRGKGLDVTVGDEALAAERMVQGLAFFFDPAGFRHEIFYSQTFMPGSFLPGKPSKGFVGDELGLPHLVIFVPEVTSELRHFASDIMGFTLLAEYPIIAWNGKPGGPAFYRCNQRTHCLGYLGLAGHRGLGHICIEAKSLDDVGKAYDLVQRREIPINLTLGRHSLDTMVSFYCRTPSGFTIEFGWDGELLDGASIQQRPSDYEVWGHERGPAGLPLTVVPLDESA